RRTRLFAPRYRLPAHGLSARPPPAGGRAGSHGSVAGSLPAGLPHAGAVPRPIEPADLDLPDRSEPGIQPAALVAAPLQVVPGGPRRTCRRPRRTERVAQFRHARPGPAAERDVGPRLARAVRSAVRPARRHRAARDRWPEL